MSNSMNDLPGNITIEELTSLQACQNSQDWNEACSLIKKARNGNYPKDWWLKVVQSGMMTRITQSWTS